MEPNPFQTIKHYQSAKETSASAPLHLLPDTICRMIEAVANDTQTPPEMGLAAALGTLAACAQGRFVLRVKSTQYEPPNLFLLALAASGDCKSSVLSQFGLHDKRLHILDDATPEALIRKLGNLDGRVYVQSSESTMLEQLYGKNGASANVSMGNILKAYSGETITVDRIGREPDYITNPLLTICILSQPIILDKLLANPDFYSKGLLPRFLYFWPRSKLGARDFPDYEVPSDVIASWQSCCINILDMPTSESVVLTLSEEATALYLNYRNMFERRLVTDLAEIQEWGSKLPGTLLRLAMLIFLAGRADLDEVVISENTVSCATEFGEYFISQAKCVFALIDRASFEDARYALHKLTSIETPIFTRAELLSRCRKFKAKDLDPVIKDFLDRNIIREVARDSRTNSVTYERNPAVTASTIDDLFDA